MTDARPDTVSVSVRLKTSGVARIDAIAEAEELTRTDVVRRLLRAGLAEHDRKATR